MQAVEKKYLSGFINADDEKNALLSSQIINSENFRFSTTDEGATSLWESILSNQEVAHSLPTGTNTRIGSVESESGRYFVYFIHNSNGDHRIFLYYKPTGTFWTVLSGAELNFSKNKLIQACIINDIVFWTDNYSEPRRINLAAAIKMNHSGSSPLASEWQYTSIDDLYEYTIIRRPPCLTGSITKETDSGYNNNFIANDSFKFAYQYIYWDGEPSVISAHTRSSKLNTASEVYNKIRVMLNANEIIKQSVRIVRLLVERGETGKWNVVKEWDKKVSATEIDNHNSGTAQLSYNFYNDIKGEALDDNYSVKPFDSVPLLSGTIEADRNRVFLGDNEEGYASPKTTSLQLQTSTISGGATSISKNLVEVRIWRRQNQDTSYAYAGWYVEIRDMTQAGFQPGYYLINGTDTTVNPAYGTGSIPGLPAAPTSIALTGLTFKGATWQDVVTAIQPSWFPFPVSFDLKAYFGFTGGGQYYGFTIKTNIVQLTGLSTTTYNVFKSKAPLLAGVVFYDRAMRKCGVVTNNAVINIPARDFNFTAGVNSINWTLANDNRLNEIPDWGYYYAVVLTKNLRTRFFVQGYDGAAKYATKDASGNYVYTTTTYNTNVVAIAIDLTALINANLGYTFSEGDVCTLIDNSNNLNEIPVLGTDGKYVLLSPKDVGVLTTKKFIYELYTPYKSSQQEPFYEMGEIFEVDEPGTSARAYKITSGSFYPDTFSLTRNFNSVTYFAEAMCPNDKFYKRWDTDHGRINIVTPEGRKRKTSSLKFSNVYVPGTKTNGLCSFEALNETLLPQEMGGIMKLANTSKAQGEGTVLLAIGRTETASIYIGEAQISDANNNTFFVKTEGVIGQVNVLRGNYGTVNPESVVSFRGNVLWFDATSGCFVQYSANGLDDISGGLQSKFSRVAALLGKKYLATSASTIEGFGSRPFIFGGVDPHHKEIYWTIPKLDATVPKGSLIDYSDKPGYVDSADYPYDILDFKAKTLVYKLGYAKWAGSYSWTPEGFISLSNELYSFKNGGLYKHNVPGSYNNFYGVDYKSKIMFPCNQGNTVKEYRTIAIESNKKPEWVHFRCEYPYEQSSDLIESDFSEKEGVFYADILRDRLSPISGTYDEKQVKGDIMREKAILVLIQFTSQAWLRFVTIGYNQSSGHY